MTISETDLDSSAQTVLRATAAQAGGALARCEHLRIALAVTNYPEYPTAVLHMDDRLKAVVEHACRLASRAGSAVDKRHLADALAEETAHELGLNVPLLRFVRWRVEREATERLRDRMISEEQSWPRLKEQAQ